MAEKPKNYRIVNGEKFYCGNYALSKNKIYNIISGLREDGKTYWTIDYSFQRFFEHGEKIVFIVRYKTEIEKDNMIENLYNDFLLDFNQKQKTNYSIVCSGGNVYLSYIDELEIIDKKGREVTKEVKQKIHIGYYCSLSNYVNEKKRTFPEARNLIFEEFLREDKRYLKNEFERLENIISTISRSSRKSFGLDVKVFMICNSVDIENEYIEKLGLLKLIDETQKEQRITTENATYEKSFILRESVKNSLFYKSVINTEYGKYAYGGEFKMPANYSIVSKDKISNLEIVLSYKVKRTNEKGEEVNMFFNFYSGNLAKSEIIYIDLSRGAVATPIDKFDIVKKFLMKEYNRKIYFSNIYTKLNTNLKGV